MIRVQCFHHGSTKCLGRHNANDQLTLLSGVHVIYHLWARNNAIRVKLVSQQSHVHCRDRSIAKCDGSSCGWAP